MTKHRLILASQSPRRKEILNYFSYPFEQQVPPYDEEVMPFNGDPIAYVKGLSMGKALSLNERFRDHVILSADTIVFKDGKIYGKPKDTEEAFSAMMELSNQWHSVFTGVAVMYQGNMYANYEETRVLFNPLTSDEIRSYHDHLHCADKAGGYAIQGAGGLIVHKIEGCYYNVMGLPINTVRSLLINVGIDLWDYLR